MTRKATIVAIVVACAQLYLMLLVQGISRSASLVLAYLIIRRGFTLHQAVHRQVPLFCDYKN